MYRRFQNRRTVRAEFAVSSSLNFCKDCLAIILEKLHELFSYLPVCEKMCKKLEPPEDDSVSLHYKLVALSNVS